MQHVLSRVSTMVAVVLMSLVFVAVPRLSAGAQEATPASGGFEIAPGVTAELLPVPDDPPALYRLHFAAGVVYAFSAAPSLDVVYVEAGTLTLQLDVPVTVARLGETGAAGESIIADTEFTVTAGDYFVLPPFATGEVRNTGDETATVSVAGLMPGEIATPVP